MNFEKKKVIPLTKKKYKSYLNRINWHICKKKFERKYTNDKNYHKVKYHCHYTSKYRSAANNLKYSIPQEFPVIFHNRSNYDYNFITKELAREFEEKINCLQGNTEKRKIFSVPITGKVNRIGKMGKGSQKQYLTNYNLMMVKIYGKLIISLLILLIEFINLNVNIEMIRKKCKTSKIKHKDCECCLEYTSVKSDLIQCKCFCCNKNYQKTFDENL